VATRFQEYKEYNIMVGLARAKLIQRQLKSKGLWEGMHVNLNSHSSRDLFVGLPSFPSPPGPLLLLGDPINIKHKLALFSRPFCGAPLMTLTSGSTSFVRRSCIPINIKHNLTLFSGPFCGASLSLSRHLQEHFFC